MAEDELQIVRLKTDFYRDGFSKAIIALAMIVAMIILLIVISIYLHITKPEPVYFMTDNDWRVSAPVPVDQPYLNNPDLLQWVSQVLPSAFTYDFLNYKKQLQDNQPYFTQTGWSKLLDQLNVYANTNTLQNAKSFVNAEPAGAPIIQNQGILNGKYAWWIQMPLNVSYSNVSGGSSSQSLIVQALIVRVSTLDNLDGVGVENLIITKGNANQVKSNG